MEQKNIIRFRNLKNESGYCGKYIVIRILDVEKDGIRMYTLPQKPEFVKTWIQASNLGFTSVGIFEKL
jgi:hypothetical protein